MIFFGTQPRLTQVPPRRSCSIKAHLAPYWAARLALAMPPEPAPMTIRSYFMAGRIPFWQLEGRALGLFDSLADKALFIAAVSCYGRINAGAGRLAQRQSTAFTRQGSLVRIHHRPPLEWIRIIVPWRANNSSIVELKNFQIVNGGQTTASIHLAHRNKKDLSQVFIQMKLSVVEPTLTEEVVPKISKYANSQNRVNAADFYSNNPFHIRIEGFSRRILAPLNDGVLRKTKWFYERARGQYASARSQLTESEKKKFDLEHPRSQLFTKTDLAKFINVWQNVPQKVSWGAQKNFIYFLKYIGQKWEKQEGDINEAWYREAIAKAIIFRTTEKLVSGQEWYQGGYRANIVAYAIAKMAHKVWILKLSGTASQ